jgi:hypothetical protein
VWDDQVGVPFGRFDELLEHRLHRASVLLDDGFHGTQTVAHVADETTHEAFVVVLVDEDPNVHLVAKRLVLQDQNALEQDDVRRPEASGFAAPAVLLVVVHRAVDGRTGTQGLQMS